MYFLEIKPTGATKVYGGLGFSSGVDIAYDPRPQMCASQGEILILAGGMGYIFDLTANTLTTITAPGFPAGATKCCFIDGYFIVLESNSQTFAISGLNDATSWNALDFGDAEGESGNIVSIIANHRQLILLGNTHSEIYYDSGDANFPFTRLDGAFMEQGTSAIDSVVNLDNTVFWLGGNNDGAGVVWRANGYTPQRISTHAVETAIQGYAESTGISDATAYGYQDGGHTFYVLTFPSANNGLGATWVYDCATQFWHERGYWNGTAYQADLARTHCYASGKHLVGDYQSGNVYWMSQSFYSDNGKPMRRERTSPDLAQGVSWKYYSQLALIVQPGVGLDGGVSGQDPQITLYVSDDGGRTWDNGRSVSMGQLGQYQRIARWNRLGRSMNRCFKVVCSESVFAALIAADVGAR